MILYHLVVYLLWQKNGDNMLTPLQKKAAFQHRIQIAQVSAAIRLMREKNLTIHQLSKFPPDGISIYRWQAMLKWGLKNLPN